MTEEEVEALLEAMKKAVKNKYILME